MKRVKKIVITSIILIAVFYLVNHVGAINYYVDVNNGNDNWDGLSPEWDTNSGPKQHPESFNSILKAGDILYFREGTYDAKKPTGNFRWPTFRPINSGTEKNPIIYKNYNGEKVIIEGYTNTGNFAIGSYGSSWVIIDGFTIHGGIYMGYEGTSIEHCKIQNCDIYEGYDIGDGNSGCIMLINVKYLTAKNCILRDNTNKCGWQSFDTTNCIIENCEVYNCTWGIYFKDNSVDDIVRNNIIYDCTKAITVPVQDPPNNGPTCYQNIIYNSENGIVVPCDVTNSIVIYNNTLYGVLRGIFVGVNGNHLDDLQMYNNIIVGISKTESKPVIFGDGINISSGISYCDYNYYYNVFRWILYPDWYDSFSTWKSGTGFDIHGNEADPGFVNANAYDFHLDNNSSCLGTGKDGINIGCYITGDEIIGLIPGGTKKTLPQPTKLTIINPVSNFAANASGDGKVTLSWLNPTGAKFVGTVVQCRTDGTYPTDFNDGSKVCNIIGNSGSNVSFDHTGLQAGTTYYYSAFTYFTNGGGYLYSGSRNVSITLP
ncbi:MAG: right-handed parallel beta-helix repeat-containing protein [Candidatus Hodarchaeota archaeon]